ncbi:uncharacterized protein LOC117924475 [Vitis riparia]|uniref:Small nuclear RNA activating complex (SNAPc), subunit SNAP43 protein n=1 Tax=Vitis vinifera TaxID=29760 RepID=D7TC57_VITVI|eukprot:XP_002285409.1 PREDICTED: uncharacterized protein LOC100262987 isoform X1 [Vitis vinifera]
MDMSSFKLDIDELINEFTESKSMTLDDMKRVWLSRKFSYIYEARPSSNLAFFMQSLYSHSISYMSDTASLSHRLGGLYCLYCLYETQPCKPPFKIYLSLGDLKKLKDLAANAKEKGVEVAPALIKRMLDRKIFLFGFVDINESSVRERVNDLADLQNARIQVAYNKLLANSRIEHFLHMDMGMEFDLKGLNKISTEYANARKLAIEEASKVVDVQNIKHISEDKKLIGDVVNKTAENWNAQKEVFYQKTGLNQRPAEEHRQDNEDDGDDFDLELEHLLSQT